MRLYHVPGTRSSRPLWVLEEIGAPYDVTVLAREDRKTDEHRARHPLGKVPALEDEAGFVFESAALCLQLADLNPDARLAPPVGTPERARLYQWLFFAMTELEPPIVAIAGGDDGARERFAAAAAVLERALEGREYLVGDRFTVADVVVGAVLGFAAHYSLLGELPGLSAYVERLDARPARQRALAVA